MQRHPEFLAIRPCDVALTVHIPIAVISPRCPIELLCPRLVTGDVPEGEPPPGHIDASSDVTRCEQVVRLFDDGVEGLA